MPKVPATWEGDWVEAVQAEALRHAKREFPKESCGLVVIQHGRARYWPCTNTASSPLDYCRISPEDQAAASRAGTIVRMIHSHPVGSANPSQADYVGCEGSRLPWSIVGSVSGIWRHLEPTGYTAPLVGREYAWGVLDCWTLIRDWFREVKGVELPSFESGEHGWWAKGESRYVEHYTEAGFRDIQEHELSHGDCILMAVKSSVPCHAAVYLGNQVILHHPCHKLSCREVWGGYYRSCATHFLRYSK